MANQKKLYTYKTLKNLITRLRDDLKNQDFVLLYAYNGTGKTRISMEFKKRGKKKGKKQGARDTLYFNAFTEDLFHWNNDLENDTERHLIINQDSQFFSGFKELDLENKIYDYLKRYVDFEFNIDYDEWIISFSKNGKNNIKVSRGEENIFIWCIFLAICKLAIEDKEKIGAYNWVKYFYIDDPISSLDDNRAITIASDLTELLEEAKANNIKTIISTHHGLFFNVMVNELKQQKHKRYFLHRDKESDTYTLQATDETPFFHHIATLSELQQAVESNKIYTHHFNMLRSVLEKTATFFGFDNFSYCVRGIKDKTLYTRALNLLSHGKHSVYEPREMVEDNKELFKEILANFHNEYRFDLPNIFPTQTK